MGRRLVTGRFILAFQFVKHVFDEFLIFVRHRQTLAVLQRFRIDRVLDFPVVFANKTNNGFDFGSEELLSRIRLIELLLVKLAVQDIFQRRRVLAGYHHMNVERERH